ncbi:1,4-alpha-glucan branching protein domain-containing protein [Fictibacillus nanhaiensis]|uniref:1,4-alpha-glucan branching protein domain-containing protein n=1 Tax=Fictibacillus nanhaiensis TaxID=742169 RepID=UPI003C27A3BF
MSNGYFSLVLHAHLPYVRHKEANRLEERWVFEALTETYIPLLWVLEEQPETLSWTLSFSPPLLELLNDPVIQKRYLEHLDLTIKLVKKEKKHSTNMEEQKIIAFYEERYKRIMETYQEFDCKVTDAYKRYMDLGKVHCMTSSATHAFLPYVQTEQGVKAQIFAGVQTFEKYFGEKPKGFWLPECAYSPGIDKALADAGIQFTFVDEETLLRSKPVPSKGIGAPVYSPHGVALFSRNQCISETIWNSSVGYPGDFDYREFYRDVAYERENEYIKSFIHPEGIRVDTGLKYWRITGETENKDWYQRDWALNKVQGHANDFCHRIKEYLHTNEQSYPPQLITAPFDAELFGHWWFEGPEFLLQSMNVSTEQNITWITPQEFLTRHYQDLETVRPCFSTWGRNQTGEVWLNESNAWMYRHLHHCERKLVQLAARLSHDEPNIVMERYADQMVREWMLAASSDWAFIIEGNSATEYAKSRFQEHIERFHELYRSIENKTYQLPEIADYENKYPFMLTTGLWHFFKSKHDEYVAFQYSEQKAKVKKKILMLSWEFPPMVVGGLARHVFDLSRKLVEQGTEVYVITSSVPGYPEHEVNNGVHVYRVAGNQPKFESFFHWTGSLNLAITEQALALANKFDFDCIHAHDWLVSVSALAIKKELNIPLITTIHATEHGRNNGITSPLQYEINQKEWELMDGSDSLIVCSDYMKNELIGVFSIPEEKITILPNGIDPEQITFQSSPSIENKNDHELLLFSVGRLVREKGFQTIIEAADILRNSGKHVRFVIAGKGPLMDELTAMIKQRNLEGYVHLAGFVSDEERNEWFAKADAALFPSHYEPFGIVALEGMAAGKLTIVSDTGGLREIVDHERTGLKIYPNDPGSIVWAVEYILSNREQCLEMAKSGEEIARTVFSWDSIAEKTAELYTIEINKTSKVGGIV